MEKIVTSLWGKGNVGKSQTIKKAYDALRSKYRDAKEECKLESNVDIMVVLTIGAFKVGIESRGDPPGNRLKKSLQLFLQLDCAVIVCATRTRGRTVEAVKELQPKYEILWLEQAEKSCVSEQQDSNSVMTQRIVKEIERAIDV